MQERKNKKKRVKVKRGKGEGRAKDGGEIKYRDLIDKLDRYTY